MRLLIVSCSPRAKKNSNTDKIITRFVEGFTSVNDNSVETFYLCERNKWEEIRRAFYAYDDILFALPLYVECIPGLMMAFLETFQPKTSAPGERPTRLSFILQGGFAEASQLRCGESYLETLPAYLGCEYGGTLIKGDMFGLSFVPENACAKQTARFVEAGREFALRGGFDKAWATDFAKPEYFSKGFMFFFRLIRPIQKKMFHSVAASWGCTEPLDARPLQKYLKA